MIYKSVKTYKVYIVIPARKGSQRFPNKPLALVNGIPMVERVWRIAKKSIYNENIYIATDCEKIASYARSFGSNVIMTDNCNSGSDRAYLATQNFGKNQDIVVSLQGDAVLTPPWIIDQVISTILDDNNIAIATPMVSMNEMQLTKYIYHKQSNPTSGTTVVFNKNLDALYFSKCIIPYYKNLTDSKIIYRHIGLYAYRFQYLKQFASLPPSKLEQIEGLEQLRALENNIPIRMVQVDYKGRTHGSVDNPQDIAFVEQIIDKEGELI